MVSLREINTALISASIGIKLTPISEIRSTMLKEIHLTLFKGIGI